MPPKRKNEGSVARRSPRSTAAPKATPTTPQIEASPAKKIKVSVDDKANPTDDEAELFSPRPRAVPSKKENAEDGKDKPEEKKVIGASSPAGKKARRGGDKRKSVGSGTPEEPKAFKEDKGSPASVHTAPGLLSRTIIIEACTQCNSFKERAEKVKKGLESAVPGITVKINPQKPRRGYFEISEEKTEVILSLPSMKRPFELMKKLNMDELVGDLVKRCK